MVWQVLLRWLEENSYDLEVMALYCVSRDMREIIQRTTRINDHRLQVGIDMLFANQTQTLYWLPRIEIENESEIPIRVRIDDIWFYVWCFQHKVLIESDCSQTLSGKS